MILTYRIERDPPKVLSKLAAIVALANLEKEALGFLPEAAYREAISQKRLSTMTVVERPDEIAGFVLYGGTYPHGRIIQLAVAHAHRRKNVASALINDVVSRFEGRSYLSVSASVAADLPASQAFYDSRGFVARGVRAGGAARGRNIVIRVRDLETPSLIPMMEAADLNRDRPFEYDLRPRMSGHASLYAMDLNVLFDLVRNRPRAADAGRLFTAALGHQFRLAVAEEFVAELQRTTTDPVNDGMLKLACQLPRLPTVDPGELDQLSDFVHEIVFTDSKSAQAGSAQARSDARHLAHATLARASGYVTSDGAVLNARDQLLRIVGIDVTSLDEFVQLIPSEGEAPSPKQLKGTSCEIKTIRSDAFFEYLQSNGVSSEFIAPITRAIESGQTPKRRAFYEGGDTVAVSARLAPSYVAGATKVLVHVRTDHVMADIFADHLVGIECHENSVRVPTVIELIDVPGQIAVRQAAALRGFIRPSPGGALTKVALGRPLASSNWSQTLRQLQRTTGLVVVDEPLTPAVVQSGIEIRSSGNRVRKIGLHTLESLLSPTLITWPNRSGVVVPITRRFADDLLGTGNQLPLFGSPAAAFLARRTYVNSPRAERVMRSLSPILFYESRRSGGRGAIVAAARIVDVVLWPKNQIPREVMQRSVVEVAETLSASTDVLVTTFEDVLLCRRPVSLETLRSIGASSSSNFQTATEVSDGQLALILNEGWLGEI